MVVVGIAEGTGAVALLAHPDKNTSKSIVMAKRREGCMESILRFSIPFLAGIIQDYIDRRSLRSRHRRTTRVVPLSQSFGKKAGRSSARGEIHFVLILFSLPATYRVPGGNSQKLSFLSLWRDPPDIQMWAQKRASGNGIPGRRLPMNREE